MCHHRHHDDIQENQDSERIGLQKEQKTTEKGKNDENKKNEIIIKMLRN